jgi:ribosomal protein S18 acetylase RimI-like enzyme
MTAIREATSEDAVIIRQMAEETWWATYSSILEPEQIEFMLNAIYEVNKLKKLIEQNNQTFILLLEDGTPVAFAGYSPREENPEIYKLHKLYCLPQTQGKGYGKLLIDEVASRVKKAGKNILELNVNRHNKAKQFYERQGFSVAYEEDIPIGPYWMNDYVMTKTLS